MPSQVVLVQGLSIEISETEVDVLSPSPLPLFATLDCIGREIQYQGGTATEIDVTTFCSTAKEFRLGLEDSGTMTVTGHWVQTNPAHAVIRAAASDKQTRLIQVTFEDGSVFKCLAFVSQRSFSAAVDGVVTATFNFRLTGPTQEIDASGA
jgi:predicted secreted protein